MSSCVHCKKHLYVLFECSCFRNDRFHVNDIDNEVVARNIILLEIISTINPDDLGDIEYVWDVWYNMTLTESHYGRLKVTLERLLDGTGSLQWRFGDRATKMRVMMTWKSWLETKQWDLENVKKIRQEFLEFYCRLRSNASLSHVATVPSQPFYKDVSMGRWAVESDCSFSKHMVEWDQVHKTGIARDFVSNQCSSWTTDEVINPTLMRPGSGRWHVHYGGNPIAAYVPFER